MNPFAANVEARRLALLAAAECADKSAADLVAFAAALRQQAEKLRTLRPPPIAPTKTPALCEPSPAFKMQRRVS